MTESSESNALQPARGKPRAGPLLALGWLSAAALFVMMVLMTLDVIGREVFGRPLTGALELIELTLVITVFAALPLASWREEHIVADLFDPLMGRRVKFAARAFACLVGAVVFAVALPHLWTLANRAISFGDVTPQLGIPVAWAIFAIVALSAATALIFAVRAVLIIVQSMQEDPGSTQ